MAAEPASGAPKKLKFSLLYDGNLRQGEGPGTRVYGGGKESCCIVPSDITFPQFQAKLWQASKCPCKVQELGLSYQLGTGRDLGQLQPLASQSDLDTFKGLHSALHARLAGGLSSPEKLLVIVWAKAATPTAPSEMAPPTPEVNPGAAPGAAAAAAATMRLPSANQPPAVQREALEAGLPAKPGTPPTRPSASPSNSRPTSFAAKKPAVDVSGVGHEGSQELGGRTVRLSPHSPQLIPHEGFRQGGGDGPASRSASGALPDIEPPDRGEGAGRGPPGTAGAAGALQGAAAAAAEGPRRPTATFVSKPFPLQKRPEAAAALPRRTDLAATGRGGGGGPGPPGGKSPASEAEDAGSDRDEDGEGAAPAKPRRRRSKFAADTLSEVTEALRRAGHRGPEGDPSPPARGTKAPRSSSEERKRGGGVQEQPPGGPQGGPPGEDEAVLQRVASDLEQALNKGLAFKGVFNEVIPEGEEAQLAATLSQSSSSTSFTIPPYRPPKKAAPQLGPKKRVTIQEPAKSSPTAAKLPLRLLVGSGLKAGQWTEAGEWTEDAEEALPDVPPHLQPIRAEDLVKVKELGRGQFGSVWLCQWLGVEVAVKELHAAGTPQTCREMLGEADTMSTLRHPCVITFYGLVINQDSPATVIEFVRGGSLRSALQRLRGLGAVSPQLRAAIALQAARGMEYLHTRRVVHFDLKCDNLLCDLRDPLRPAVKIGDLGLSKQKATTFVSGNMRGTLPWMANELFPANGREEGVTEKVDVFSFGVCMFEIWTCGAAPYTGLSVPAIFSGVMSGRLRPAVPADCPASWAALMQACWHSVPTARPAFDEVAKRLEGMVADFS